MAREEAEVDSFPLSWLETTDGLKNQSCLSSRPSPVLGIPAVVHCGEKKGSLGWGWGLRTKAGAREHLEIP